MTDYKLSKLFFDLHHDDKLASEYRAWQQQNPALTAGMVRAAQTRQTAEWRALQRYVRVLESGADA